MSNNRWVKLLCVAAAAVGMVLCVAVLWGAVA